MPLPIEDITELLKRIKVEAVGSSVVDIVRQMIGKPVKIHGEAIGYITDANFNEETKEITYTFNYLLPKYADDIKLALENDGVSNE